MRKLNGFNDGEHASSGVAGIRMLSVGDYMREENRLEKICSEIISSVTSNIEININTIEEYNELIKKLK